MGLEARGAADKYRGHQGGGERTPSPSPSPPPPSPPAPSRLRECGRSAGRALRPATGSLRVSGSARRRGKCLRLAGGSPRRTVRPRGPAGWAGWRGEGQWGDSGGWRGDMHPDCRCPSLSSTCGASWLGSVDRWEGLGLEGTRVRGRSAFEKLWGCFSFLHGTGFFFILVPLWGKTVLLPQVLGSQTPPCMSFSPLRGLFSLPFPEIQHENPPGRGRLLSHLHSTAGGGNPSRRWSQLLVRLDRQRPDQGESRAPGWSSWFLPSSGSCPCPSRERPRRAATATSEASARDARTPPRGPWRARGCAHRQLRSRTWHAGLGSFPEQQCPP